MSNQLINSNGQDLKNNLNSLNDLESFLHDLSEKLESKKLKTGSDLSSYVKSQRISVPGILGDAKITYQGYSDELGKSKRKLVIVTKPDKNYPEPIARKIFCIKVRSVVACLECGWIWCRIVIYY
jgi:hypothetical protein